MISATGGLPAHRHTPQVTPRWPRGSEPASVDPTRLCAAHFPGAAHAGTEALGVQATTPHWQYKGRVALSPHSGLLEACDSELDRSML